MLNIIAIRADGGLGKGMGHIMRCIALAKELKVKNIKVIFLTKYSNEVNDILNMNRMVFINIKSNNLDEELVEVINIIKLEKIDAIITDSYWLDNNYLKKLKDNVNLLISIDDNNIYRYPNQIVINGNIYANELNYQVLNKDTKLMLGNKYTIIREEFNNSEPIKIKPNVKSIMVTMGGTDINNFTPIVLKSINNFNYNIDVVVTNAFQCKEQLNQLAKLNSNINIIYNPKNICEIMKKNDIAISAAGTTTYELAVLGVPTILIVQAENQEHIAKKASDLNMMMNLGYFNYVSSSTINQAIYNLINNFQLRLQMNYISVKTISTQGTANIVNGILEYYEKEH